MRTLNTYIEEKLVVSRARKYNNEQKYVISIENLNTFKSGPRTDLICGSITIDNDIALFYYFYSEQSTHTSSFYVYTDKNTYNELYDEEYTEHMHANGQQGAYTNKEFRSKLGDALWDKKLWAAPDNLVFLRTYDEIEGDFGYCAPDCKTTTEKQKWVDWIKYFNEISGETLDTNIDDWEYSAL